MIKALKQQITEMQSRNAEIAALRKNLAKAERENARLAAENQAVNESLEAAQKDKETLSTKLAAARAAAPPEPKNVPGSAVKQRTTGVILPGQLEAAKKAQFQDQKLELYIDLTNLLVMGVKKSEEGDDVYDCIQTGRNGSKLHDIIQKGSSLLTHDSSPLPAHHHQRRRLVRGERVRVSAAAGRAARSGSHRASARLPY